jgi:hypothetical protein
MNDLDIFDNVEDEYNARALLGAAYVNPDADGANFQPVLPPSPSSSDVSSDLDGHEVQDDAADEIRDDECTCKFHCYNKLMRSCSSRVQEMLDGYFNMSKSEQDSIMVGFLCASMVSQVGDAKHIAKAK